MASEERERISVTEYREQNLLLLRQTAESLAELSKDMKDVRERTVKLESENVSGMIAGLRADLRTYEERQRRGFEDVESKLGLVEKAHAARLSSLESNHSVLNERVSGIKGLIAWVSTIAGGVLIIGLGLVLFGVGK